MNQPRVAIVIPSVKRPDALTRVLDALGGQTVPPTEVVVAVPDPSGVPDGIELRPGVKVIVTQKGASAQRNAAVRALGNDVDVIGFLDDDSVPREDYVEQLGIVFGEDPALVALSGRMACDGADAKTELTPEFMQRALVESHEKDGTGGQIPSRALYGCNMAIRHAAAVATPFDEALPLYSWLEDLDVARRLERLGRVVQDPRVVVAHQGNNSGGRTSHRRFGYSVVANAVHLYRKGSVTFFDLLVLVSRPTAGNIRGLFRRAERGARIERLRGSAMALFDISRGRVDPGRIVGL